ncbi:hypothetical protein IQ268_29965 [Oculatella sp. LEGE 06141]|uniref:hypothetical protein n=1 Tax=Oculatella sp. LEGE 06141 TaxID=1828648 RepID=UPI0018827D33|nr:hypothetical protein [Oculatella sp. LEGE 06141]MBE9182765.1 hypothetical protein [Oculatella sp. LEGE 06141]
MADFIDDLPIAHEPQETGAIAFPPRHPSRRPLRVLLLGDKQDVINTIKNLHRRGFAEAGEWSKPVLCPNSAEMNDRILLNLPPDRCISILTKYLTQE